MRLGTANHGAFIAGSKLRRRARYLSPRLAAVQKILETLVGTFGISPVSCE